MTTSLAAEAERLAVAGRRLDAIDLLMRVPREKVDEQVERNLVRLRHDAFSEVPTTPVPAIDRFRDPFPSIRGAVAEIDRIELSTELLAGAIAHHGCLLVRGLVDRNTAERLTTMIDRAFEAQARWRKAYLGFNRLAEVPPWFVAVDPDPAYPMPDLDFGRAAQKLFRVAAADCPPAAFECARAFEEAGLRSVLTEYLGGRPVLSINKWQLRRLPPKASIGWHQEALYLGDAASAVNVWLALSPCGTSAPGLDVIARPVGPLTGAACTPDAKSVAPAFLDALTRDVAPVRPEFAPGDALLFDHHLLHRTAVTPSMTQPRYSIESWFFAAEGFPTRFGPLVF